VGHADVSAVLPSTQMLGDGVAGWVGEHRRPLLLGPDMDPSKFWRFKRKPERIFAAMVVPLQTSGRLFGVLSVSSRSSERIYRQEDLRSLQVLSNSVSLSLLQLEQAEELRELRNPKKSA
jgi:signal transduction protein with GAF and PtsI domain